MKRDSNSPRCVQTLTAMLASGLVVPTSCGGGSQIEIRPLIDMKDTPLGFAQYDDGSLKARLEKLNADVASYARRVKSWGELTTDLLNPEITSIVFIDAVRTTNDFGYGTEATSMLSRDENVIFVMAGDTGSCWGIRFGGNVNTPTIRYTNLFALKCSASLYADSVESVWVSAWPVTAIPVAGG